MACRVMIEKKHSTRLSHEEPVGARTRLLALFTYAYANRALVCHSRPPGNCPGPSANRRSIQARPLMRDVTGARTAWNGPLRAS
jgi:hypothetical protein